MFWKHFMIWNDLTPKPNKITIYFLMERFYYFYALEIEKEKHRENYV